MLSRDVAGEETPSNPAELGNPPEMDGSTCDRPTPRGHFYLGRRHAGGGMRVAPPFRERYSLNLLATQLLAAGPRRIDASAH